MNRIHTTRGGILLMVMVIVGMLTVMFIGSVGIVSRELHVTSDATQKERIYQVAESGVQRVLFLVEQADYTLDQLVALSGTPNPITDPVANAVVGSYTLSVVKQGSGQAVDVLSIARSPDNRFCTKVSATINSPSGSAAGPYFANKWNRSVCPADTVAPNPPTALPAAGTYNATQNVALSAEAGAAIYYTANGTNPTTGSTLYASAISIAATTTVRAIAVDAAGNASTVMVAAYTIDTTPPAAPVASPTGGSYASAQSVSLSAEVAAAIRYTLDGSTPTVASTLYSSAITISSSKTLKAIAIDAAGNVSPIMTEVYTFTFASGAPAIDLIGQYVNQTDNPLTPNYTKSAPNDGQASQNQFGFNQLIGGVVFDVVHHRLFISEAANCRVFVYNLNSDNTLIDRIPDKVLGKPSFTTSGCAGGQAGFSLNTWGLAYDGENDRLFVADTNNQRVMIFDVASITNGENAINVLGKVNFTAPNSVVRNQATFSPRDIEYDSSRRLLFVGDSLRVMIFDVASITNGENAINVLGQVDFTTFSTSVSQSVTYEPESLAYDEVNRRLFVGERGRNRVTVYDVASITNGENAINVLGSTSFTSSGSGNQASGMSFPEGLAYDSLNNRLFVADTNNNRVMVFDVATIANGENAIGVLGQTVFTVYAGGVTQSKLSSPQGLGYDSTNNRLFVSDFGNNRVMIFSTP